METSKKVTLEDVYAALILDVAVRYAEMLDETDATNGTVLKKVFENLREIKTWIETEPQE